MSILVTRPSVPAIQEYVEEIRPIFESQILTNMGPIYQKLQRRLAAYLDVPELTMFVNGHMALELAIQALGLRDTGGEVITTPFTFVSTANAIARNGLKPVFCDIKPYDYTIDPEKIEAMITERTVAIVPVHVYGNICDVDAIGAIAEKHHLKVIYDAAHAFGVRYRGVGAGNFGDASMFSFHATKVFNTVEGGAVTFRDPTYRQAMEELQNFGIHKGAVPMGDVTALGTNAKMDEFRAAMGVCNLRHIDEYIAQRRTVHEAYFRRLSGVPGLRLCPQQEGVESNYAYFPVCFDPQVFGKSRDEVFSALEREDIHARKYFYPAINDMSCYAALRDAPATPVAHAISMQVMCLPMYTGLTEADVDQICDVILR